ncbi:acyl-CoA dehydrogenase family protein [Streptomyces sp. NPDC002536]
MAERDASVSVGTDPADPEWRTAVDRATAALPPGVSGAGAWAALGGEGLLAPLYRDRDGSRELVPGRLAHLLAALDASAGPAPTLSTCVQAAAAWPLLAAGAAAAPAGGVLATARDAVLAGRAGLALAATEAGSGSDLAGLETTLDLGADGPVLTGVKRWITNGTAAEHLLVLARHRPGRHFTCFTWVLVPAAAPGVELRPEDTNLFPGAGIARAAFTSVRLTEEHLVGRPGRGLALFARHMAGERLAGALWAVALCRRVLAGTQELLATREADGRPLWHRDGIRQRVAGCLVRVRQLHALCRELAPAVAERHDATAAALLKASAAETVDHVLTECSRLHGAEGFTHGGVQQLRAQAAVFGVGGGTTDVVLGTVADNSAVVLADLAW